MTPLRFPPLSASPHRLLRSGLTWMRPSGATVSAREPVAACNVRAVPPRGSDAAAGFPDEQNDLQVVLAPAVPGVLRRADDLSRGGFQDLVSGAEWDDTEEIGALESDAPAPALLPLVLMGRRGFDSGEGRGGLLPGWHERARASWEGTGSGRFGTVLSYGTCELTGLFRGEDMAFLSWFERAPGPAQIVWVSDERTVHSSAVILQHLRRTPAEARAITEVVHAWIGERIGRAGDGAFPAFRPEAARGTFDGRWPEAQSVLFALYLLAEAVGASPVLERTRVLTRAGVVDQAPPDAVALTLGSEFAPHFRHRKTGWVVAFHGFRFGQFIGPGVLEWLRRDFERLPRTVADIERDLGQLVEELAGRTGAAVLVQNLIASSAADRVANYAWLGDEFASSTSVAATEVNLAAMGLTRHRALSVVDSDALAAELGVHHCPDRFHAGRTLLEAQRAETHRILRSRGIPGF